VKPQVKLSKVPATAAVDRYARAATERRTRRLRRPRWRAV